MAESTTLGINRKKQDLPEFGTDPTRLAVEREPGIRLFFSNLKQFLTERPVKIRGGAKPMFFTAAGFGDGIGENVKEFFRPLPKYSRGTPGSELLVNWKADFGSFWDNLRDLIAPRKLPPLKVSSRPVPVKDIWSKDTQFTRVQALSLALHVVVLVLIIVPLLPEIMAPQTTKAYSVQVTPIDISPYMPKLPPGPKKAGGGGGGGEHNPVPASVGKLPKFDFTRFTPPAVKPPTNPKMAMTPTVLGPPDMHLPSPNMQNWGDPLSKIVTDSSGPGGGGGIGSGQGGGVGSGGGGGVGPGYQWGTGGGFPHAGQNGFGEPTCVYCPQPEFSDEAVKAKYQGTALLQAVVTPDGRATDIHVVKGLGLGLDEKAIEAVRKWRFKPAAAPDGRPSAVITLIEVTFHLY
ncbi:MAG: energy transducer TonB [Candidatus Acidiferrales bacterium]